MREHIMRDAYNRVIDYMRVSVTDRCNLRCGYCMPEGISLISHDDVLRYEEIIRLCAAAARAGVRTIKVTGGEPLARKGCVDFIKTLKTLPGVRQVTLTTNGVLLEPDDIDELAGCGLDGLNISLDSLNPETYRRITGRGEFHRVWRAFESAVDAGLRVKINCVPIKGVNDGEIIHIAGLAEAFPVDVRFIELMPAGAGGGFRGIPGGEILRIISGEYPGLRPDGSPRGFGPARYFSGGGLKGSIGLIDPVTHSFCEGCNRLRLTSDGQLKLCLYHDDSLDLRGMLRTGAGGDEIEAAIKRAACQKPKAHLFGEEDSGGGIKNMPQIGG